MFQMFHVKHLGWPEEGSGEGGMFHVKHSPHPPVFHRLALHLPESTHYAIQQERVLYERFRHHRPCHFLAKGWRR
jgi:hypothetical protein